MRGALETSVLIPVKAFHEAKGRLAGVLDASARELLARAMATNVVDSAHDLPVAVVCDDEVVAEWAGSVGATVVWQPGVGLDGAVRNGVAVLASAGADQVLVAHGDLPHATDLRPLLEVAATTAAGAASDVEASDVPASEAVPDGDEPVGDLGTEPVAGAGEIGTAVLVPDRRRDGTNVILIPSRCGFRFSYGAGSFTRHLAEARRLGLLTTVVEDAALGWDVDVPEDLVVPDWSTAPGRATATTASAVPRAAS